MVMSKKFRHLLSATRKEYGKREGTRIAYSIAHKNHWEVPKRK